MELYYSFTILIVIATLFSFLNNRYLKLPATIGVMVIAMVTSLGIVLIGDYFHKFPLSQLSTIISSIDFSEVLMGGMLNFLLFAGAIHINLQDLKEQKLPIVVFSSLSVILSTLVVGFGLYYVLGAFLPFFDIHIEMPLVYCLLFGALISPTDPIAVLAILKEAKVSKAVETKVAGESLFNDGVAVVVFAVILSMTAGGATNDLEVDWGFTLGLLAKEVIGGVVLGYILGKIAWHGMKSAMDLKISVLITLSVVMGGYLAAGAMHFSGPLAMVVAGLIIGDSRRKGFAHKENANNLNIFWQLIDEVLNAILFLFIGFELLLMPDLLDYWLMGVIAIIIVLFARYASIKIPTWIIPFKEKFSKGTIIILVWGGLRGAVSIALALSIAEGPYKKVIIAATYFVVVFSILIQGLSIGKIANRIKI